MGDVSKTTPMHNTCFHLALRCGFCFLVDLLKGYCTDTVKGPRHLAIFSKAIVQIQWRDLITFLVNARIIDSYKKIQIIAFLLFILFTNFVLAALERFDCFHDFTSKGHSETNARWFKTKPKTYFPLLVRSTLYITESFNGLSYH